MYDCIARDRADGVLDVRESNDVAVCSEEIDIVVAQIRRIARIASLEFALRVGAVIIHHFYDGDANAWRSRGPKTASFRRLAQHPDLPLSPGSLYRCVALYELCDRLNAPSRWEHLGASHLRLVIGLPCQVQERLLAVANAGRWTVKALEQAVQLEKRSRTRRGGQRARPPIARSVLAAKKWLDDYRNALDGMQDITPEDVEESIQILEETKSSLERLEELLRAASHG